MALNGHDRHSGFEIMPGRPIRRRPNTGLLGSLVGLLAFWAIVAQALVWLG